VIHAAGVLDDGLLLQQTTERFARVLAPKVQGAWNLHTLTRHLPLDFFVVFSSATSLFGNAGQGNHAAANVFLDALAHQRRRLGLPALSLNWGAWSEIGSAAEYVRREQHRLAAQGEGSITPVQGMQIFATLLGQEGPQIGIVPIDWGKYLKAVGTASAFFQELAPAVVLPRPGASAPPVGFLQRLAETPQDEQHAVLVQHLRAVIGRVLRLRSTDSIALRQGLRDVGLDSLMALEVRGHLETDLHCALPATLLFDYPTLEALTRYLSQDVLVLGQPGDATLPPTAAGQVEARGDEDEDHEDAEAIAKKLASQLGLAWSQGHE
jgi:myxalamid-type polyketide synthase MxaB